MLYLLQSPVSKHVQRIPLATFLLIENSTVDVSGMGYSPGFERFRKPCVSVVEARNWLIGDFLRYLHSSRRQADRLCALSNEPQAASG